MAVESEITGWVLLVDDHEDGRDLLSEFLAVHGFQVEACASGEEALERVAMRGAPQIVVTDLSLGAMSGAELARKLRAGADTAAVPIVAVTGHASYDDPDHLFNEILVKPVALQKLADAVKSAISP